MASDLIRFSTWPGYLDPTLVDWPRPLRLMAWTTYAIRQANQPIKDPILSALQDLRQKPSMRVGEQPAN